MVKIIERLFGNEEKADELRKIDFELGRAIEDIKKLEEDWKEKMKHIKEFLEAWNENWNVSKLRSNIRVVGEFSVMDEKSSRDETNLVLSLRKFLETKAKTREFPIADYAKLQQIFKNNQSLWLALEKNLQSQVKWINDHSDKDIGVIQFKIKEFVTLLKEEGKLLGLEVTIIKEIRKIESYVRQNFFHERTRLDKAKDAVIGRVSKKADKRASSDLCMQFLKNYGFDPIKSPKVARIVAEFPQAWIKMDGYGMVQYGPMGQTLIDHYTFTKKGDSLKKQYFYIPIFSIINKFTYIAESTNLKSSNLYEIISVIGKTMILSSDKIFLTFRNQPYNMFKDYLEEKYGKYYDSIKSGYPERYAEASTFFGWLSEFDGFPSENELKIALSSLEELVNFLLYLGYNRYTEHWQEYFAKMIELISDEIPLVALSCSIRTSPGDTHYRDLCYKVPSTEKAVQLAKELGLKRVYNELIASIDDALAFFALSGLAPELFLELKLSFKDFSRLCEILRSNLQMGPGYYYSAFEEGGYLRGMIPYIANWGLEEFIAFVESNTKHSSGIVKPENSHFNVNSIKAMVIAAPFSRGLNMNELSEILEIYREGFTHIYLTLTGSNGPKVLEFKFPGVDTESKKEIQRLYDALIGVHKQFCNIRRGGLAKSEEKIKQDASNDAILILQNQNILSAIVGVSDWEALLELIENTELVGRKTSLTPSLLISIMGIFIEKSGVKTITELKNNTLFADFAFWLNSDLFSDESYHSSSLEIPITKFAKLFYSSRTNFEEFKRLVAGWKEMFVKVTISGSGSFGFGNPREVMLKTLHALEPIHRNDLIRLRGVAMILLGMLKRYGTEFVDVLPNFKEIYGNDGKKFVEFSSVLFQVYQSTEEKQRNHVLSAASKVSGIIAKQGYENLPEYAKRAKPENCYIFFSGYLYNCTDLINKYGLEKISEEFILPLIESQSVTAAVISSFLSELKGLGGLNTFEDALIFLHIGQKYPVKAIDIYQHILLDGIKKGILPKNIASEAEILKYFLQNAPAYILDLYKDYRDIYLSDTPNRNEKITELFRDVFEIKEQLYTGELKEIKNEGLFYGVLYHTFPPELSVDRSVYKSAISRRQDRQSDIPSALKRLMYLKVRISKGGHFVKKGETLDAEPWQDLIDASNAKEGPLPPENVGLDILKDFVSNTIQKTRKKHLNQLVLFSKQRGESLPAFSQEYQILMKYKEFIGDRMNDILFLVMTETQSKHPKEYSELVGQIKRATTDFKGLSKTLANLWNSNVADKEKKVKKILEKNGIFLEQILWSTPVTPKEIEASLFQTKEGVIEKSLIAKIKQAIYGQEYSGMQKEALKFEFKREGRTRFGQSGTFVFTLSKRHAHCIAMFNMGVCVAVDDKMWESPDVWQLIIFDEQKNGCGGAIYRTIEEDGKKYLVISIEPNSTILSSTSPEGVYDKIIDYSKAMVKLLKYDSLLIPESAVIHSNRGSIQTEITKKSYRKIKLKEIHTFSYSPYNYTYQEFFIV